MSLQCPQRAVIHVIFFSFFTMLIILDDGGPENIELCPFGTLGCKGFCSTKAFRCNSFSMSDFSMN